MATASPPTRLPVRAPLASPAAAADLSSAQLRDFYGVLRQACQALPQVEDTQAGDVAQALADQLTQVIELQTLEASRVAGLAGADAEMHARYLKAALADELLLTTDWAGRPHWRQAMLESRLFRTSHAGEKVYADIDKLLAQRDPAQRPVARLYLSVLSLGFQGRYRGSGSLERIVTYRRELFQFIFQRAPDLQGRDRTLSPAAYASTLSHVRARRLPRLSRGWVQTALALLGLLLVSQVLWLWLSWPLRKALDATAHLVTGGLLC